MKKCILLLIGAVLFILGSYAQTTIPGGYFTVDRTLTLANSPYLITANMDVSAGVTITVEKDVEIRFNSGRYIQVFGTLNAKGAKFTANSSTTKGFWDGIYVSFENNANIGNVTLDSCTVEYASNLYARKGQLTLKKCTLDNFSGYGVQLYAQGTLDISQTTIKNSNNYPIYLNGPGILKGTNNNLLTGNANDYIYIYFQDIPGTFYMPNLGIPYYIPSHNMQVTETGTLMISAGVDIKFNTSRDFTVRGKIKALGTSDHPIIFDRHTGASNWRGMNISTNAIDTACIFKHCIFKNATSDNDAYVAMGIDAASPSFENCLFTGNYRNLIVTGISQPTFTNCNFDPSTILGGESYNVAIDMNAIVDFTTDSIKFNPNELRTLRIMPSTVTSNAQLKKISFKNLENITYCLYGTTTVNETASLVIDPGVIIKCRDYTSMIVANGTLTGIGTELEPIVFTHLADDNFGNPKNTQNDGNVTPTNSNSGRIAIYGTATSQIKNWKIHYGGYNSDNWAVYVSKGNIVENCEIKNSYRGIYFYDNAQLLNNAFININSFPVGRKVNQGTPVLIGNTVASVGYIGILIGEFATDSPTLKPMNFAGFTNVAYIIENQLSIAAGNVVSIDPGVVIKFIRRYYGYLSVGGAIKATGKENNKIIFTSISDDSAAGDTNNDGTASVPVNYDWQGLDFTSTASDTDNILKNCEIRYCGYSYYWNGAVRITDCRVVMDSTKVNFSYSFALNIFGNANPEITNCQFYNLNEAPIYMDMFSNPTFAENKVSNVPRIGLRIRGGSINGTIPVRSFAGYDTITYIIEESMTVPNSQTLIIPAGLSFKGSGIWYIRGKLDVQGTAEKPVVFTTQEDDMYGSPKDMQQNGQAGLGNNGNYFVFYDESDDASKIDHALFRYSKSNSIQMTNASPKILNSTFQNIAYPGIALAGSSTPSINGCTFNNASFPFTTSLVTYPAETNGNIITGTTGRAIRISDETLTKNVTLVKRDFAGITNIPFVFQNYTVGTGAILTINPGIVCKFGSDGYLNIQNGLLAKGGGTTDSTIVFTADRDDFYGGDTYNDGDANLPANNYWQGIYFYNESIDENCKIENCIFKNASYVHYYQTYYNDWTYSRAAISLNNASPTIKNSLFENCYDGILSWNTSLPKITNCDFVGTDPTYGYGIYNTTSTNTITAEGCWWNHNTGPRHSSNPGGLGERVSDYVDFTPFALQLAKPVLGDVSMNGEVKPFDASLVLQHAAGTKLLTAKQQGVADVSGNGMISSYDASLILQYSVGLISRFDPEPAGTKSATITEFASISFPNMISETIKKTFEIPLTVSTSKGIKALDMKYVINQKHVKFIRLNKDKLPDGISIESGFNAQNGEIIISMASAYDLNLNNQQIALEFEFIESVIHESQFNQTTAMANDHILTNMGYATISSKSGVTGLDQGSRLSEPVVYTDQYAIHAKFDLSTSNQELFIQIVDLAGRIIYKRTIKNLSSGLQYLDLLYTDFDRPNRGIYILNLRADDFSYTKKLLIK